MYSHAHREGKAVPPIKAVEPRFDVGNLSKAHLGRSRRHFNEAQRWLEKGDADEALEELFRAQRFYTKAIPYSADPPLLRGIFYYYYLARQAAQQFERARDAYCEYVSLTRNLAGSAGPIEQFEPLADKCGGTAASGTAEIKVTSNFDGAHVWVDGRHRGVIGRTQPFVDPFIPAGPHLIEVRKVGYARWGTLAALKDGTSKAVTARLVEARNRSTDYDPLAKIVFDGEDAYGDAYLVDLMFEMSERYGVTTLVSAFLEPESGGTAMKLTVLIANEEGVERREYPVGGGRQGHYAALTQFWLDQYGEPLNPGNAQADVERWAPTLFKVE